MPWLAAARRPSRTARTDLAGCDDDRELPLDADPVKLDAAVVDERVADPAAANSSYSSGRSRSRTSSSCGQRSHQGGDARRSFAGCGAPGGASPSPAGEGGGPAASRRAVAAARGRGRPCGRRWLVAATVVPHGDRVPYRVARGCEPAAGRDRDARRTTRSSRAPSGRRRPRGGSARRPSTDGCSACLVLRAASAKQLAAPGRVPRGERCADASRVGQGLEDELGGALEELRCPVGVVVSSSTSGSRARARSRGRRTSGFRSRPFCICSIWFSHLRMRISRREDRAAGLEDAVAGEHLLLVAFRIGGDPGHAARRSSGSAGCEAHAAACGR